MNICKLDELLTFRHPIFVVGDADTDKNLERNPTFTGLKPKAVTDHELYISPMQKPENGDGLLPNFIKTKVDRS